VFGTSKTSHALHKQRRQVCIADCPIFQTGLNPRAIHSEYYVPLTKPILIEASRRAFWPALRAIPPQNTLRHVVSTQQARRRRVLRVFSALEGKAGQQISYGSEFHGFPITPHTLPLAG
jgi:hypothetical protein